MYTRPNDNTRSSKEIGTRNTNGSVNKRSRWYESESIVLQYYEQDGWQLLQRNFTVRWWEIDLIIVKEQSVKDIFGKEIPQETEVVLCFVEVKDVSQTDDIMGYITPMKRKHIKRTIHLFLQKMRDGSVVWPDGEPIRVRWTYRSRCDVVFVKNKKIYTVIEECVDF